MKYSAEEVLQYVKEDDVKFIRLAFCDVYGKQKNISIMPDELARAFKYGIAIDASAIKGFGTEVNSDLFLHPDPSTVTVLPWRPEHGRVVRMFCKITYPNGEIFECDTRSMLIEAVERAKKAGYSFAFGSELEFYLFLEDENGNPTKIPYDQAGYMDIAPDDKGENVRREICLTLEQMGIRPESSHHEEGPGQNEIDFRYSDPLTAADNAVTFLSVVKTIASRNGLYADFSPKPLPDKPGSGLHINFSVKAKENKDVLPYMIAGILDKIEDMTVFLNPIDNSYKRLGNNKAPRYISWSRENRSPLIRIPASVGEYRRAELRSSDPTANPYIAYTLLIGAALHGINHQLPLPPETNLNLFTADAKSLSNFKQLPTNRAEAAKYAANSDFIQSQLPASVIDVFCSCSE